MSVFKLTAEQKKNLSYNKIDEGQFLILPFSGIAISEKQGERKQWMDGVDMHEKPVRVLRIVGSEVEMEFVKGRVKGRPFWVRLSDLEYRGPIETWFATVWMYIPYVIQNIYRKFQKSV